MLRTVQFACTLPKGEADALNAESGRIYTDMLVRHYRLYRKQGVWLAPRSGERLEDTLGGPTTLHAHSRDAAQQGFYKACKTARAGIAAGMDTKYPHWRKRFRTTIWKRPKGLTRKASSLLLGRARGLAPVQVALPSHLAPLACCCFLGSAAGLGPGRSELQAGIWWWRMGWNLCPPQEREPQPSTWARSTPPPSRTAQQPSSSAVGRCAPTSSTRPSASPRFGPSRPASEALAGMEAPATAQEPFPGEAEAQSPRYGAQGQPGRRHLGEGTRRGHAGHWGCARCGRWEAARTPRASRRLVCGRMAGSEPTSPTRQQRQVSL